jgi:hypothetical protein
MIFIIQVRLKRRSRSEIAFSGDRTMSRIGSDQREIYVPEMATAQSRSVVCGNDEVDNSARPVRKMFQHDGRAF